MRLKRETYDNINGYYYEKKYNEKGLIVFDNEHDPKTYEYEYDREDRLLNIIETSFNSFTNLEEKYNSKYEYNSENYRITKTKIGIKRKDIFYSSLT